MFCNHQNTLKTGDCNLGPTVSTIRQIWIFQLADGSDRIWLHYGGKTWIAYRC